MCIQTQTGSLRGLKKANRHRLPRQWDLYLCNTTSLGHICAHTAGPTRSLTLPNPTGLAIYTSQNSDSLTIKSSIACTHNMFVWAVSTYVHTHMLTAASIPSIIPYEGTQSLMSTASTFPMCRNSLSDFVASVCILATLDTVRTSVCVAAH